MRGEIPCMTYFLGVEFIDKQAMASSLRFHASAFCSSVRLLFSSSLVDFFSSMQQRLSRQKNIRSCRRRIATDI